ncbi:MAG: hypothetical protein ABIY55_22480 [Kofleriaceae bacterium]
MRTSLLVTFVGVATSCGGGSEPAKPDAASAIDAAGQQDAPPAGANFSFFITSAGNPSGGDFRRTPADTDGLAGADAFCQSKAAAAVPASASRQWRAYLSTDTINAKDRIGAGPWFNRNGVMVAASITALLDPAMNLISKATGLDETGATVPGRGDTPNQHDILTGSTAAGIAAAAHCQNWTSSAATGDVAQVGHFDRMGGGDDPMSWSTAHVTQGCAAASFPPTGGRGSIYCFAAD